MKRSADMVFALKIANSGSGQHRSSGSGAYSAAAMASRFLQTHSSDESSPCKGWMEEDDEEEELVDDQADTPPPAAITRVQYTARTGYRAWTKPKLEKSETTPDKNPKEAAALRKAAALAIAASSAAVKAGQAAASAAAALAHHRGSALTASPAGNPPGHSNGLEAATPQPLARHTEGAESAEKAGLKRARAANVSPSPSRGISDPAAQGQEDNSPRGRAAEVTPPLKQAKRHGKRAAVKGQRSTAKPRRPRSVVNGQALPGLQATGNTLDEAAEQPDQGGQASAEGPAEEQPTTARAARGTAGTFAGHRPPKSADKLAAFNALRDEYFASRAALLAEAPEGKQPRNLGENQKAYHAFMKSTMAAMAGEGAQDSEHLRQAAEQWRKAERTRMTEGQVAV